MEEKVLIGCDLILNKYNPIIVAEYWGSISGKNRGFYESAREDIIHVMNNYTKYQLFDTIKDGISNLVFIPDTMLIQKKAVMNYLKLMNLKSSKVGVLNVQRC